MISTVKINLDGISCHVTFPKRLSVTGDLLTFKSCPYRWFLRRCLGIGEKDSSVHLDFGRAFADALQKARLKYFLEGTTEKEALDAAKEVMFRWGLESPWTDEYKNAETGIMLVDKYFDQYPFDGDSVPFEFTDGTLSVEYSCEVSSGQIHPLAETDIMLYAKPDYIGIDKYNNVTLVDEKTSSRSGKYKQEITTLDYQSSPQFLLYASLINKDNILGKRKIKYGQIRRAVLNSQVYGTPGMLETYEFTLAQDLLNNYGKSLDYTVSRMRNMFLEVIEDGDRLYSYREYGNCVAYDRACGNIKNCINTTFYPLSELLQQPRNIFDSESQQYVNLVEL
jgi:hypothetical protein